MTKFFSGAAMVGAMAFGYGLAIDDTFLIWAGLISGVAFKTLAEGLRQ